VRIDYEPLPAVLTLEEALEAKTVVWGHDNVLQAYLVEKGDIDSVWEKADCIVEGEYFTGAQEQLYIETQGVIAWWDDAGVHVGDGVLLWGKVWRIIVTAIVLAGFCAFDRYSRYGLATRATAIDEEAALEAGIPVRRVNAIAWGLAGAMATIAGVFLSGAPNVLDPSIGDIALLAFPAIIIGGLNSPAGAVVGGLIIGLVYEMFDGYSANVSFLGHNFYSIAPYIVMIIVLLIKPYGIFGRAPVERV